MATSMPFCSPPFSVQVLVHFFRNSMHSTTNVRRGVNNHLLFTFFYIRNLFVADRNDKKFLARHDDEWKLFSFLFLPTRHTGCSSFLSRPILNLQTFSFHLPLSLSLSVFAFSNVSLSTIPANARLFACSPYARTHASNRLPADKLQKKILFFFSLFAQRGKNREKERKSNSIAEWSRVTVHIKSNYKCSLASSLVFSLSVSSSRLRVFFFESFFLLHIEKEEKVAKR